MTDLYSKLVTQINAFNSLQNLLLKNLIWKNNLLMWQNFITNPRCCSFDLRYSNINDVKEAITKITSPNLVDNNGNNIIGTIGDGTTPFSSQTAQTASEIGFSSPYTSSFGLSLELFLTSILVTQAYGGQIMKSMLQIANENGVGIDSVWIDVVKAAPPATGNVLNNYVIGGTNDWAKSSQATIDALKTLLQNVVGTGPDAEKEYNYYMENGLYAFNERLPTGFIADNGQPINHQFLMLSLSSMMGT